MKKKISKEKIINGETVDLSGKEIDEKRWTNEILPLLKQNKSVVTLNLANNKLGDGGEHDWGIKLLYDFITLNHTITSINLNNNDIGWYGGYWLISILTINENIKQLTFDQQIASKPIVDWQINKIQTLIKSRSPLHAPRRLPPAVTMERPVENCCLIM